MCLFVRSNMLNGSMWRWLLGILGTLLATSVIALTVTVIELRQQMAVIEASSFTDRDGAELYRQMIEYHIDNSPPDDVALLLLQYDERLDRLEQN